MKTIIGILYLIIMITAILLVTKHLPFPENKPRPWSKNLLDSIFGKYDR